MKTVVLKLEDKAIGDFEKIGTYRFNLITNLTVGNIGIIRISAIMGDVSELSISGGDFYSDEFANDFLGPSYLLKKGGNTLYYKLTDQNNPYIEVNNIHNINGLGYYSYMFGDKEDMPGILMQTSDLHKFIDLNEVCFSKSQLRGQLYDIPESVNNLRLEYRLIYGTPKDIKSKYFTHLRLMQSNITGNYRDFEGKTIKTFISEMPLVTGDVASFTRVKELGTFSIGNYVNAEIIAEGYPVTCSLSEDVFFDNLDLYCTKHVHMSRDTLLRTLRSLSKTKWGNKPSSASNQVYLTTTMGESEYNDDSELQLAASSLRDVLNGGLKIYFVV